MRDVSHTSWIKIVREEVEAWRQDNDWSRETVVAQFVEEFSKSVGLTAWGIDFSDHPDIIQRQKNDADKVYRWLNDFEKDTNLLGLNFSKIILQTLPLEYRIRASAKLMVSIGLTAGIMDDAEDGELDYNDVAQVAMSSGMTVHAVTRAVQVPTPENIQAAEIQLVKDDRLRTRLRKKLQGAMSRPFAAAKAAIGRVCHKKERA